LYLGIDIGTSGVKAVLVSEAGAVTATAARELALSLRAAGRIPDRQARPIRAY